MTSTEVDFETIKKGQRAGWETGDYPRVGNTLQIMAEQLIEAVDVRAGQKVLDVASGQGNAAMAAARRFARSSKVPQASFAQATRFTHLDPLTATPSRNHFLQTVVPFLKRIR